MSIGESLAQELTHEAASTRKILEAIPDEKWDYTPHEKSMAAGPLGSHIAESLMWGAETVNNDEWNMDPKEYKPWLAEGKADLLSEFDKNLAAAIEAIRGCSDEKMFQQWRMTVDGKEAFAMPRVAVLRFFIISHMIHHRAQLSVYLRMLDVPVPQVYGPTADFPDMMGG